MRSRASGGTCGDSVAAASAATMSSLRRRAIWVQRAMSTERSSIGGRASARTTAAASEGSASSRSQASTSRISARWKNAACPTSRCATARSSSATATAWPSRATSGTSTTISPGRHPLAADQPLDVGGHRLGLGAVAGAAPEGRARRRARRAPAATAARARRRRPARARGSGGPRAARPRARPGPTARDALGARAAKAPQRVQGIAGGGQPAPASVCDERGRSEVELLDVVDEHVLEALGQGRPVAAARAAHRVRHRRESRVSVSASIRSWVR